MASQETRETIQRVLRIAALGIMIGVPVFTLLAVVVVGWKPATAVGLLIFGLFAVINKVLWEGYLARNRRREGNGAPEGEGPGAPTDEATSRP